MALITSRLQKGAGWGPLKVHHKGEGRIVTVRKHPRMEWYKVLVDATEYNRVREFSLGMTKEELLKLREKINEVLK